MNNKMSFKRVAAIIGIVLLAGMYLSTLIFAIIGNDLTQRLLMISLISTIAIPIIIHFIIMFYKIGHKDEEAPVDSEIPEGNENTEDTEKDR